MHWFATGSEFLPESLLSMSVSSSDGLTDRIQNKSHSLPHSGHLAGHQAIIRGEEMMTLKANKQANISLDAIIYLHTTKAPLLVVAHA